VRVIVSAAGDPAAHWRVTDCPACSRTHDRVAVALRRPREGERLAGAVPLAEIAEPLEDVNAGYPHPIERRVSLC